MCKACLLFVLLLAFISPSCGKRRPRVDPGPSGVVGGIGEPDYRYPWVVDISAPCKGVLLHPQWVLTAAHCILPGPGNKTVSYHRTDPYTGAVLTESREPAPSGVFIHPKVNVPSTNDNDLALIKLAEPFVISPYIQTVGLPSTPIQPGLVGTVASINQTNPMLPAGMIAIFRAPVPPLGFGLAFLIGTTAETGALCKGDSGSGFVTYENGRATVRGTLSTASGDCLKPAGELARFIDVFLYRDWIFETIRTTDYRLAGTNRVRWSSRVSPGEMGARGVMGIGCVNPFGTMWGPLNVFGVQEGANCEPGQTQTVVCSLTGAQAGPRPMAITGFTMKTDCPPHGITEQVLPFTATWASFTGPAPVSPDPVGICIREFTCHINSSIFSRGDGVLKP